MPGAYTKHMEGERYEKLCNVVDKCSTLLNKLPLGNSSELQQCISHILLLVMDYSKQSVEEFCYAGGFHLFFTILKRRSETATIGKVSSILRFFSVLLLHQVDPYDDDLGVLPMLTYFLCERHTHSIDIEWNERELTLMGNFIDAHTALLTAHKSVSIESSDQLLALHLLTKVLQSFPPHRVVNSSIDVLSVTRCRDLFNCIAHMDELWSSTHHRLTVAQLIFSLTTFGLGHSIAADLPLALVLVTVHSQVLTELRCPCGHCEFMRRIQRAARERDEFGVTKASNGKKRLCYILLKANVLDLLVQLLRYSADHYYEHDVHVITDTAYSPVPHSLSLDESALNGSETPWELKEKFNKDVIHSLHTTSDYIIDDTNVNVVTDQIMRLVSLNIGLLSFTYDEMYRGSTILMYKGKKELLSTWIMWLNKVNTHNMCYSSTLQLHPGVRVSIQTLCALALRSREEERRLVCESLRPVFQDMLRNICDLLVATCGPASRYWEPFMGYLIPTFTVMLLAVVEIPEQSKGKVKVWQPLNDALIEATTSAVATFREGFECKSSSLDHRVFIKCLLLAMSILTGTDYYLKWPETRRVLFPNAHPSTGFMASAARWILQTYNEHLACNDACVLVKMIGSLVISRAEKASAVVSRPPVSTLSSTINGVPCF